MIEGERGKYEQRQYRDEKAEDAQARARQIQERLEAAIKNHPDLVLRSIVQEPGKIEYHLHKKDGSGLLMTAAFIPDNKTDPQKKQYNHLIIFQGRNVKDELVKEMRPDANLAEIDEAVKNAVPFFSGVREKTPARVEHKKETPEDDEIFIQSTDKLFNQLLVNLNAFKNEKEAIRLLWFRLSGQEDKIKDWASRDIPDSLLNLDQKALAEHIITKVKGFTERKAKVVESKLNELFDRAERYGRILKTSGRKL